MLLVNSLEGDQQLKVEQMVSKRKGQQGDGLLWWVVNASEPDKLRFVGDSIRWGKDDNVTQQCRLILTSKHSWATATHIALLLLRSHHPKMDSTWCGLAWCSRDRCTITVGLEGSVEASKLGNWKVADLDVMGKHTVNLVKVMLSILVGSTITDCFLPCHLLIASWVTKPRP